jgi:hypothetical protein
MQPYTPDQRRDLIRDKTPSSYVYIQWSLCWLHFTESLYCHVGIVYESQFNPLKSIG